MDMTLEIIEKELRRHPLWEREIPVQMQMGLPYLYLEDGVLYLRYKLHRRIFRAGRFLVFPDRYELELLLPGRKIVCFRALRRGLTAEREEPVCTIEQDCLLGTGNAAIRNLYACADRILEFTGSEEELEQLVDQYQNKYREAESC